MGSSGGLTPDNIGVEYAGVVFAIAESPKEAGVIWAGTNDGLLQLTRDGGKTWTNLTRNIPNLPEWGTFSNIEASRYDAATAYVTVDFHQMNNRDPFVYKTNDYGKTWTQITNGIQHSMLSYAHCIREDPVRQGLLYLGTENALYISFDDGKSWQPLQSGLPHAPAYWMTVQERFHDLVVATYGRGFWILDDITALEQLTPQIGAASAYLFAPRDAYRFRNTVQPFSVTYDPVAGQNVPYGADINFYLKSKPGASDRVRLTISDASGKTVRTADCNAQHAEAGTTTDAAGPSQAEPGEEERFGPRPISCHAEAGINRVWWDLRGEPTTQIRFRTTHPYAQDITPGSQGWRAASGSVAGRIFLLAPPGVYTVKLMVNEQEFTQKLNVLKDPHSTGSESDIAEQMKLLSALREDLETVSESVNKIEILRSQLISLDRGLGNGETAQPVRSSASDLGGKLLGVEGKFLQMSATGRGQDNVRYPPMLAQKLTYLASQVGQSDFPPTTQQQAVAQELHQQAQQYQQQFAQVMEEVQHFNALLREHDIPNIFLPTSGTTAVAASGDR
jgi:hypothetical protein